jgi:predicted Zn-dependent protease
MAAGRFDEAVDHYAAIVKALPDEPGMRLNLGMALSMAGRAREAVPQLQAALKQRPDLAPASLFLGAAYVELAQPAQAVAPLQAFLATQPGHAEARRMLAGALLSLERYEPAARHYEHLCGEDPRDPRPWFGLGRSYEGLSQRAFETLQAAAPESPYLILLLADAMLAQERDKSAFALYREAIAKKPGLVEGHEGLARVYDRAGHPEWAQVERERARALPRPDCRAPGLECDFRAGRHAQVLEAARPLRTAESRYWASRAAGELAREAFERLAELPPSPEAALVRVDVLRAQRRYLESKQALENATSAWPQDARLQRELATLHLMAREYPQARPILEELLKREPEASDLNLQLGEAWLESKEPARAIPCLEKAVRADPKVARGHALLGRALVEAGQSGPAIPHLEAALPSDEDGSLHLQLARAYRETGRTDDAARTAAAFQENRRKNESKRQDEEEDLPITPP